MKGCNLDSLEIYHHPVEKVKYKWWQKVSSRILGKPFPLHRVYVCFDASSAGSVTVFTQHVKGKTYIIKESEND